MFWKSSPETRAILAALKEEIEYVKQHMANGSLLSFDTDEHLVREYCRLSGYMSGLNIIEDFIEREKDEDKDDDSSDES